jgi:serine/threonine-protein kinase
VTATLDRQYAFDGYRLDARTRELRSPDGAAVALTSKAFEVLLHLVEHRDRVIGKDELLGAVWTHRVVEENNLTQAISALRKALGGGASDHRYIVTVPGRGYRFVAAVSDSDGVAGNARADPGPETTAASVPVVWRQTIALGALLFMLALFAATAWRPRAAPPPAPASQHMALAVLPFRSLSPAPRDEALELGMAESLIAQLSRASALRVRSLAASQRLDGRNRDPVDSGRRLGVAYVVEGSTQRRGEWIRVNARLLTVEDGRTLWAGTFDAHRDRVFTLQDRIAAEIGAALALPANPVAVATAHRSPCEGDSAEAYRAYVTGRYLLSRASAGRLPEALAALRRAIALDPSCARAHAGLASLYVSQALTADADPRTVIPLARAAVARSLAIDPASAEAYLAKGGIEAWSDWNWSLAAVSFQRAIALDPGSADAHLAYSMALNTLDRRGEASDHVRRASELDPLSPVVNVTEAAYLFATDPAAARVRLAGVLELEPDYWAALVERSRWAMAKRRPREAIADLQRAVDRSHRNSVVMTHLAKAHLAAGERDRAQALLDELQARRRDGYVPATALATIHVALGNTGLALDELERGYAERDVRMAYFTASRSLDALHGQSRFLALARRVGPDAERWLGRR